VAVTETITVAAGAEADTAAEVAVTRDAASMKTKSLVTAPR
jgi:hypothetical protein